ncbi:hypothetical protein VTO42DRAFT_7457 [Malbranchea cinnamomea]
MSHRQRRLQIPRRVSSVSASSNEASARHASRDRLPTVDRILDGHLNSSRTADVNNTDVKQSPQMTPNATGKDVYSSITESGDDTPRVHDTSAHVPSPETENNRPPQNLRQRASSPLLGQPGRRHRVSLSPMPFHVKPNPLRVSESASTLRSFYDPQQSPTTTSQQTTAEKQSDLALRNHFPTPPASNSTFNPNSNNGNMGPGRKDRRLSQKAKLRPSMIDLSKLFPKPREPSIPLLSPHRMTSSPSPVSMLSDESVNRTTTLKFDRIYKGGNKLSKAPGRKEAALLRKQQRQQEELLRQEREAQLRNQQLRQQEQLEREQEEEMVRQQQSQSELLLKQEQELGQTEQKHQGASSKHEMYRQRIPKPFRTETESENGWDGTVKNRRPAFSNWFDGPEGRVSDDEEDDIDDILAEGPTPAELTGDMKDTFCESIYSHANSFSSSIPSNFTNGHTEPWRRTQQLRSTSHLAKSQRNRSTSMGHLHSGAVSNVSTTNEWERSGRASAQPVPVAEKRSKIALDSSNLNESSVLCLSSSEDEEEDDASNLGNRTFVRDSIATFDEGEICTARAAVAATRRPSIRSVRPNGTHRSSRPAEATRPPSKRDPSVSSSTRSSNFGRVNASRGSSVAPAISEPVSSPTAISSAHSLDFHLPRPRSRTSGRQTPDRRSRFLAVTRQEEYLLELLRRNKGVIPPHLFFNDNDSVASSDPDGKTINRQSLASYHSDTSFFKLSPGITSQRPSPNRTQNGARELSPSRGAGSEYGDLSMDHSNASARFSLAHSDLMPSPSTGVASPRTPPVTNSHRVSLTNPHPPPSFSPPPVPEHHRHSRTRTDSSSAIVFDNNGNGEKEVHVEDLPIWALGWNQELTGMAVAH